MDLTPALSPCRAVVPWVPPAAPAGHDVVVTPHPLTLAGRTHTVGAPVQPGDTLASVLARHGVDLSVPGWHVHVGGLEVPVALCSRTRVRPGQLIEAHRVPGKSAVRLLAIVALAYFTMGTGLAAGGLGGYLTVPGFAGYAINVGAFMVGSAIINKLLPPGQPTLGSREENTTYSLQGARNSARQYAPLGLLLGQVRVAPDFAALPYSWFESSEQYQHVLLHAGLNVATVDDLRIGDTAITTFSEVQVTRAGFPAGNSESLAWEAVDTIAGGALDAVTAPGPWVERTSSADTMRLQVDIVGDLHYLNDGGGYAIAKVNLDIEYRLLPSGAWLPFQGGSANVLFVNNLSKPLRRTVTRDVAAGQYAVRMRKTTANDTRPQGANALEWQALKSYQAAAVAPLAHQVVGIRIKASGQVQGVLDQVTWLATSKPCPLWNGSAWVTTTTSNPGALALQFLRGEVDSTTGRLLWGYGKPDDQIDIEGLKAFMVHCTANGYRFDHWFSAQTTRREVLDALAAAGLGSVSRHTGKLGIVFMAAGQPIEAVVNMGNVKRGSMRVDYATRATAEELEVASPERTSEWRPATLRVLAPGVTLPRETARLSPAGVTTQAGRLTAARYAMAQNIYGRKSVSWEMDLEHLTLRRWSIVALSHDLTQWGHGGRLHGIVTNLALYSEDLRNTAEAGSSRPWSQFNDAGNAVVVDLLTALPPTGMQAYSKLRAGTVDTTVGVQRQVLQSISGTVDGDVMTCRWLAKAGECRYVAIAWRTRADSYPQVLFDLLTGVKVSTTDGVGSGITGSIVPTEDDGWWQIDVTLNLLSGSATPQIIALLRTGTNANFVAAAVGHGLFLTGVVVVKGTRIDAYARTTSAPAVGIELDAEVPAGSTPYVGLRLPGEQAYRVFGVAAFTGTARNLTLSGSWPSGVPMPGDAADNPAMDTLWIYDFAATPGIRLRVTDIAPTPDLSGARITAVPEPDDFWTYMASGAYTAPASTGTARLPVVSGLRAWAELALTAAGDQVLANLTWDVAGSYASAVVMGAISGQPLAYVGTSYGNSLYGWEVERGVTYEVEVRPFDALGRPGQAASVSFTASPIPAAPANVGAFTVLEREGFGRVFFWDYTDFTPDLAGFQARYVATGSPSTGWDDMAPLFEAGRAERSASVNMPGDGAWIFAIKAVDLAGNSSPSERRLTVAFDQGIFGAPVLSAECGPAGWPGTLTNCGVRDYYLIDSGTTTWATLPATWAGWTSWAGAANGTITYQHSTLDLGSSAARWVRCGHVAAGSVTTEYQGSADGVTYTSWAAVPVGLVTFRYIRLRWTVTGAWPVLYRAQIRIYP